MGFSSQEYWSGLPFPSPGDLSNPGIEPASPALQADALLTVLQGKPKLVHFPVSHTFLRRYQNTRLLTDLPKGSWFLFPRIREPCHLSLLTAQPGQANGNLCYLHLPAAPFHMPHSPPLPGPWGWNTNHDLYHDVCWRSRADFRVWP